MIALDKLERGVRYELSGPLLDDILALIDRLRRLERVAELVREMDDNCYLGRAHERGCGQSATARCVACEAIELSTLDGGNADGG